MLIAAHDTEWQRRAGIFLHWLGCGCRDINRFWHWVRLRSHGTLNLMCSVTTDEWPHYRIIERQIHLELVRAHSLARGMRRTRYDHIPPSGVLNRCREREHGLIMCFDSWTPRHGQTRRSHGDHINRSCSRPPTPWTVIDGSIST